MDVFTKKERSEIMSRIRGRNTSLENGVFEMLRKKGVIFSRHYKKLPGKPDIVLVKAQKAVFIDSDFWHGWRFPIWKTRLPKKYWQNKIENNRTRDRKTTRVLRKTGWGVLRVWEHQIKSDPLGVAERIRKFLDS